jgi:hypothetical protein
MLRWSGVRTRTVVTRSACHFHVLHRRAVEALRAEIPVLDRVCLLGCFVLGLIRHVYQ